MMRLIKSTALPRPARKIHPSLLTLAGSSQWHAREIGGSHLSPGSFGRQVEAQEDSGRTPAAPRVNQFPVTATRKNLGAAAPPACKGTLAGKAMLTASTGSALSPDNITGVVPTIVQLDRSALNETV